MAAELSDEDKASIAEIEKNNRLQKENEVSLQKYLKKNPNSMKPQSDEYWDLAWHARLADAGDEKSQYIIAQAYETGNHVDQNPQKAVMFYQKACDSQHAEACMRLGQIYSENKILQKDSEKALYWFTKAGKLGYIPAQFKVAAIYADQENYEAAALWEEEALKVMFPDSKNLEAHDPKLVSYRKLATAQKKAAERGIKRDWRHESDWLTLTPLHLEP